MLSGEQNKYILAIDLGTSALKVALVTTDGQVAACETLPMHVALLPEGGAEQDPAEWWRGIVRATKSLLQKNVIPVSDVAAVSCSAQWSGTVAVDRGGQPLMPAIIWMDSRGGRYVKRLTGGPINLSGYGLGRLFTWVRLTAGAPAHSGKDPIAHILYLKHERPEIYTGAFKFLEPKDYLNLCLTGLCAASHDSIILHWVTDNRDISKIVYSDRLLKLAGIERGKLPDLRRAVDVLGPLKPDVARELGLNPNLPVVMGTPDLQAAAIGSGAIPDFEPLLYIGTSSFLICHVPFKKTDLLHNMASLPSPIPNRYFLANEQESAGICPARQSLLCPGRIVGLSTAGRRWPDSTASVSTRMRVWAAFCFPGCRSWDIHCRNFDFRLPGVTSMSADTHKYGYAAKGTSVVLYRGKALRRYQYHTATEWPGGLYFSPTLAGSRSGALSAACSAAMLAMGEEGYTDAARRVLKTAAEIKKGIIEIPELRVLGNPLWIIAFASDVLDIYRVLDFMSQRHWSLNGLHKPPAVHLCVTLRHTQPGVAKRFIADLRAAVEYVRTHPDEKSGMAPIYGLGATLPLRGVVGEMLKRYMDLLYEV